MSEHPNEAPRHRWFQFQLRTLLVVLGLVSVILAYRANWIRQRRAAAVGWKITDFEPLHPHAPARAPGLLWLLGERGYGALYRESSKPLTNEEETQLAKAELLFPEALVVWEVFPEH
ncbi:MAG: hypothetical protein KF708_12730 [Pirellulales bacterium]|nr:hypothetical protein [Pirellulales bacterium]